MLNKKYILGLILIISVVWLTMILCLMVVYLLLPSLELSTITYIDSLLVAILRLLIAGFVLLVWLYSWNRLVKMYFQRNLNRSGMKREAPTARKRKVNKKMIRVSGKPAS
jgi:uncharacterized protein YacL